MLLYIIEIEYPTKTLAYGQLTKRRLLERVRKLLAEDEFISFQVRTVHMEKPT